MSNSTFADAMTKIAGQAQATPEHEPEREVREEHCRAVLGHARGIFVFLLVATVLVFGFHYRVEIQHLVDGKPWTATQAEAGTGVVLKGAHEQAAARDALLGNIVR